MPSPVTSDEDLCTIIWQIRTEHGACTLGQLVAATGQTKQALASRLRTMQKRGLVKMSPGVHGSIRTADEQAERR